MTDRRPTGKDSPKSPLRVLFFEDCVEDVDLSVWTLRSAGFDVAWDITTTIDEFMERLRSSDYDVILSDYRMPFVTGTDAYERARSEGVQTPFILVTGSLGDEHAVDCLKGGMADYVLKDRLARLPAAVRQAVEEHRLRLERVRAEEALRRSEAGYRSLIQSAPCGILRLNAADGRLLEVNPALAGMLGYDSPADLLESRWKGGIWLEPETLSGLTEAATGPAGAVECDVCWERKEGDELQIKLAGRLIRDVNGAPQCLEMIAENVTERRRAQQRIEKLHRLYSVLIHAGQVIVRIRQRETLFQEICRIVVEQGGFQRAWLGLVSPANGEISRQTCWPPRAEDAGVAGGTPDFHPERCAAVARALRNGSHVVRNDLAGPGQPAAGGLRVLGQPLRSMAVFPIAIYGRTVGAIAIYAAELDFFDAENIALLSGLAADLSFALESIETERTRHQVAGELDQFLALSLDLLFICDRNGWIQRLNPAWEKALGFSAAEMSSKPWTDFVHPEDRKRAAEIQERLREGYEVPEFELRFRSKAGPYKWLVGGATPAPDRGVAFAAMSDITHRKQLEEQLRRQNLMLEERSRRLEAASRMKSEFLANMSHELRSPLNGIIGFSELLYDGKLGALPPRPREFVGRIHASALHLLQLINGVLDLSKIEAGRLEFHPERVFLSHVIQEVTGILTSVAAGKRIQIGTEIDPAVDEVTVDPGRLRQVLYNYLSNALKFTGEGGQVGVRVTAAPDNAFCLEVRDSGIGIAEDDIGRLFVEFQQLDSTTAKRYQGTGLGLALTKRIVEAQGGSVGVVSKPGEGSIFHAVLPRTPRKPPDCQSGRILVVDDGSLDRLLVASLLESRGYVVETAASSAEAYDKCRRMAFDAITLDLVLPDCPGWETLTRIRSLESHKNTPVIVISGAEQSDVDMPFLVDGYITKPVDGGCLLKELEQAGALPAAAKVA